MTSTAREVLGLVLCFLGLVGLVVSTSANEWKVTSRGTSLMTTSWVYEGLWRTCVGNAMGTVTCKRFFTIMGMPRHLKVCQALMIISVLLAHMGALVALIGIKRSRSGGSNRTKARTVGFAGVLHLLAGLTAMVALSYYAHRVTMDFFNPHLLGARYEYGWCLYVGWATSSLSIIGALILCLTCYGVVDDSSDTAPRQQLRYSSVPTELMITADRASVYSNLGPSTQQQQQQQKRQDSAYSVEVISPESRKMSLFPSATETGVRGGTSGEVSGAALGRRASDGALLDVDRSCGPGGFPRETRRASTMSYGRNSYV